MQNKGSDPHLVKSLKNTVRLYMWIFLVLKLIEKLCALLKLYFCLLTKNGEILTTWGIIYSFSQQWSEPALCLLLTLKYFYQIDLMLYLPKVGFHKEVLFSESTLCSISESTALWSFWQSSLEVKQWKTVVNFYLFIIQSLTPLLELKHGLGIIWDCHRYFIIKPV